MAGWPNVWGNGILFAYSGMDGETSWACPMVGSTRSDPIGIAFPFQKAELQFGVGLRAGTVRLAGNDAADLDLVDERGRVVALRLAYLDRDTLLAEAAGPLDLALWGPEESPLRLATWEEGGRWCFALARSEEHEGLARAREAAMERVFAERVAFFERLPALPSGTEERVARLYAKACSVLKVNAMTPEGQIAHRWTTPDRWPHRDMWLWDSAFHAPAYACLDPAWGQDALLAVLSTQYEDGFVAHQMNPGRTSHITQPPVLGWACWAVYEVTGDCAFLDDVYPGLCRYLEWDLAHRDWNGDGLLGWYIEGNPLCRSGESGMDNSPRFDPDGPWDNVDLNTYAVSDMRCVAQIARELGRDAEAARWDSLAQHMSTRMNELLWDEETGFYYDRNTEGGLFRIKSNAGFLPLYAGVAEAAQAERLVAHLTDPRAFWTPMPVPTIAVDEPAYQADMWRGPTWININSLIRRGLERYGYHDLSREIRERTLAEIARWYEARGCLYEYYDCQAEIEPCLLNRKGAPGEKGGTGFGVIADYNWTAAWTVLMLLEM